MVASNTVAERSSEPAHRRAEPLPSQPARRGPEHARDRRHAVELVGERGHQGLDQPVVDVSQRAQLDDPLRRLRPRDPWHGFAMQPAKQSDHLGGQADRDGEPGHAPILQPA
jgi:hypothetical protein